MSHRHDRTERTRPIICPDAPRPSLEALQDQAQVC